MKSRTFNCSPLCGHCEVEVSERTAVAIIRLIREQSQTLGKDSPIAESLAKIADGIKKGSWHAEYDRLAGEDNKH